MNAPAGLDLISIPERIQSEQPEGLLSEIRDHP
jgi:hypothetical protein